jgi:hypothetical protein
VHVEDLKQIANKQEVMCSRLVTSLVRLLRPETDGEQCKCCAMFDGVYTMVLFARLLSLETDGEQ